MSDPRRDMLPMHEAQHSFDVVLRGYDRNQVAETIERLEADFRVAIADRDAAMARSADLASQLAALHGEIESLRRKAATASAPTFENISERIQHMLQLAEEEAAEIRRSAEQEAQAVREHTAVEERAALERNAAGQAEVERMLAEARQHAEQIVAGARQHAEQTASAAQIRADELVSKAQERVARLDAESQARRAKIEEDFDIAQRARRAEAARVEEERERVSTQAARQRVAAAEQHAAALVAEAEASAAAIREVRDELTARLLQARSLLGGLPDLSDAPPQRGDRRPPAGDQAAARQPAGPGVQERLPGQPAPTGRRSAPDAQETPQPDGGAPTDTAPRHSDAGTTGRLPLPPRPGMPGGSTAAGGAVPGQAPRVQPGPPTQAIDQPAGRH